MIRLRVRDFIAEHDLLEPHQTIVVGVSGGADSLCLLLLLHEIAPELRINLHVAHLNHLIRPEAESDAAFVASVAAKLGLPCTIESRDVPSYARERSLSLEAAAREVRYSFLRDIARTVGAERVAVGHTADDQAETVLMRFVRGAGLAGLRGMQARSVLKLPGWSDGLVLVRPLLGIRRNETEQCCERRGYRPVVDESNRSPEFLRNRVRLELLPLLEQSYNPGIRQVLLRTAAWARDEYEFLISHVEHVWPRVIVEESANEIVLSRTEFNSLPTAIKRLLLRRAYARISDGRHELSGDRTERMLEAMAGRPGVTIELPGDVELEVSYTTAAVFLSGEQRTMPLPPLSPGAIKVPGQTRLGDWTINAVLLQTNEVTTTDCWQASFDFEQTGSDLWVRSRRQGDVFQPLGLDGVKKLQDFFVDAKVPRSIRDRVPIVESPAGIIWIVGLRIDQRFRVTSNTKTTLKLEFTRNDVPARES